MAPYRPRFGKKSAKGVMVLIVALPPSASLSDINIHSIDLFSELAKKQTVCQGINPDRSVALLCFI